jgi:hypothetical protein
MDSYKTIRIVKIIGYTIVGGSFGLALTFMAMAFGSY